MTTTPTLATTCEPTPAVIANLPSRPEWGGRTVSRCNECKLVQFETKSGDCRKCHKPLHPKPEPEHKDNVVCIDSKTEDYTTFVSRLNASSSNYEKAVIAGLMLVRFGKEMSQAEFATKLGVPRTYITKYENGKTRPLIAQIHRILDAHEISRKAFWFMVEIIASGSPE